ncbi:tubulin-like doman-containing protein [Haloplanus sp.]|uniref:tubulin-like doman-containing protein n=1 Tax=Haloplanus sp. TaxID=1961696 RepID=UPI002637DC15|nr:tubulin-like doman-containing protein [Haloplanus sp.]
MVASQGNGGEVRASVPDMIVGLGWAGKQVVYDFMETDWIVEEGIDPRQDDRTPNFEGYVVDTASDEQSNDRVRIENINDRIERMANDLNRNTQTLDTAVEYINPLDGIDERYTSRTGLTAEVTVRDIAKGAGLQAWWLENNDEMLVGDSYEEGVIRRRALSKALFHASNTGNNPLDPILNTTANDVYMVVGLGGGTGSGMFLDIARRINDSVSTVHLFAVIPGEDEATELRANAHAALSEVEYLSRTGQSPFKNVVLVPFGPVNDEDEFDQAVAQTIMAHRNLASNQEDRLDVTSDVGAPKYAPFTVAVPQTARFAVNDAETAKKQIDEFLTAKEDPLEAEHALYDALEGFVIGKFDNEAAESLRRARDGQPVVSDQFSLSKAQAGQLRSRFDRLQEILEEEIFDELGYESALKWRDTLSQLVAQQQDAVGEDAMVERDEAVVTSAAQPAEGLDPVDERYPREEKDQALEQFVRNELTAITRRGNLYRTLSLVDNDDIAEGIKGTMDPALNVELYGLTESDSELAERIDSLGTNIALLETFKRDVAAEELEETKAGWENEVRSSIEAIIEIDENQDELSTLLADLEQSITSAVTAIDGADASAQLDTEVFEFDRFGELNRQLREIGEEPVDETAINTSIGGLRMAKRASLRAEEQAGSGLSSLLPWVGDGADSERRTFEEVIEQVDDELFEFERSFDSNFYCVFKQDGVYTEIANDLTERRSTHLDEVVDAFERRLRSPRLDRTWFEDEVGEEWEGTLPDISWPGETSGHTTTLRNRLSGDLSGTSAPALVDELTRSGGGRGEDPGTVHAGLRSALVTPIDDLIDRFEADRETVRGRQQRIQRLKEIMNEEGRTFSDGGMGPKRPNLTFERNTSENKYISTISSGDQETLLGREDLVGAELHHDEGGLIAHRLTNFAENVARLDGRLPLEAGTIEADNSYLDDDETIEITSAYDGHRIVPLFMGRAFAARDDEYGVADEIEETLRGGVYAQSSEDGYKANVCPFGGPWDTSLITFVGGVFLDNLAPVRGSTSGYQSVYMTQRDTLSEDIKVRHTHGLDGRDRTMVDERGRGAYLYRHDLINLNDPSELNDFVDATEDDRLDIFETHTTVSSFESTVDLDDSG